MYVPPLFLNASYVPDSRQGRRHFDKCNGFARRRDGGGVHVFSCVVYDVDLCSNTAKIAALCL